MISLKLNIFYIYNYFIILLLNYNTLHTNRDLKDLDLSFIKKKKHSLFKITKD